MFSASNLEKLCMLAGAFINLKQIPDNLIIILERVDVTFKLVVKAKILFEQVYKTLIGTSKSEFTKIYVLIWYIKRPEKFMIVFTTLKHRQQNWTNVNFYVVEFFF